ncbi:uncharacterized protein BDZ99DRAFT_29760 [Mytilinidion resinicola]|uniref:Uncharacterized protein n=1 Tax=Mytilinidion resinicola TaxID=574789 RepID=A0A6A6YL16_9PEZI|nr:uncharacterized protein BDZ99DRAFT_29760 [Mytilinidion resinicola]KAF2809511.1 hypothetical protein BDZ99DRAFT_29760 [Mytilinidion resinicola]
MAGPRSYLGSASQGTLPLYSSSDFLPSYDDTFLRVESAIDHAQEEARHNTSSAGSEVYDRFGYTLSNENGSPLDVRDHLHLPSSVHTPRTPSHQQGPSVCNHSEARDHVSSVVLSMNPMPWSHRTYHQRREEVKRMLENMRERKLKRQLEKELKKRSEEQPERKLKKKLMKEASTEPGHETSLEAEVDAEVERQI